MAERQGVRGIRWPPERVYLACTFQGLGTRKEEFLERIIQAFEAKGFRKIPPIEPFNLSWGWKSFLSFWDWSKYKDYERHCIAGSDVLLMSKKNGPMAIRAEVRNEDLRFGYVPYQYVR